MLPKKARLTKKIITLELGNARRIKTAHFLVIYTFSKTSTGPLISVSASKKVAKTAVERNLLRRRAYSAVAPLLPLCVPTARVLVQYTQAWKSEPLSAITTELQKAFKDTGISNA